MKKGKKVQSFLLNKGLNPFKVLLLLLAYTLCADSVIASNTNITEQVLYSGITQGDKSFTFYTLKISNRYFTGSQSLAFKVVSEAYDSDPDIFISKTNQQPQSASESQWYCMKAGSDTCIVKRSDINYEDFFYIGVRCLNPCTYSLRAIYAPVSTLTEATKTQFNFDGYATYIFEYYIPSEAKTGQTLGATLMIESENVYNPIDMFFSVDDDLYQVEERKSGQLIQNGKAYFFNSDDYFWCTKCYTYIMVDVINPGRYYVTGTASARNDVVTASSFQKIVNARSQECYQYYVQKQENDLQIQVSLYQGDAELFISPRNAPNGINDEKVKLVSARSSQRSLISTSKDRARYGYPTGLYYICLYGYIDTSAQIILSESNYNYRYDAVEDMLYTLRLESPGFVYYRYTSADLTLRTNINIKLEASSLTNETFVPRIFYKVCPSQTASDCYLDVAEAQGNSATMQEIGTTNNTTKRTGTIYHNPSVCTNVNSCFYLISIYYARTDAPLRVTFKLNHDNQDPTNVNIDNSYRNIKKQDSYEYYELLPGSSDGFPYTDALIFDLSSFSGDAEIYMSVTNRFPTQKDYMVRSAEFGDMKDKIVLNRTAYFSLDRPLYFSIYAYTQIVYQLDISAVYSPTYNAILQTATPLSDGVPIFQNYSSEVSEGFFSFYPWWPASENRTMVFVGDVFTNPIFFFVQKNDFPLFYLTEWQDQNDVVAIGPDSPGYDVSSKYYMRIRPDFALYDLLSSKPYDFNIYAFTQLPSTMFQDLQHNEKVMGYANGTSMFYRYLISNKTDTIVVTVSPLQGNPKLLIKLANSNVYANSSNVFSYDFKSDNPGAQQEQLNLTYAQRIKANSDCDFNGYARGQGVKKCNLYIGVECLGQCVYNITLLIQERESKTVFQPPSYLDNHKPYYGKVKFNVTKYFYYPIHQNNTGEMAIHLNKTGPLTTNGDTMIFVSLQNDTSQPVEKWKYPTLNQAQIFSYSNSSTQPELIEICSQTFAARCKNGTSCALVIGVLGLTKNQTSQFRLTVFNQETKLFNRTPISGTIETAGQYHYYWFVNNVTVTKPNATWEYIVASSTFNKSGDVDLYMSGMDSRHPNSIDFDWFSDNVGPDNLYITQTDPMFYLKNWNMSSGIFFVVGVKALTNNASYSLIMNGPTRYKTDFIDLNTTTAIVKNFSNTNIVNNTHVYKWFNWGHRDFKVQLEGLTGSVYMFFNQMDEETFSNDGFLAVPINKHNSKYSVQINATQNNQLKVYKTDHDFCYFCWYYLTVYSNYTLNSSSYRISLAEIPDNGDDIAMVVVGDPNSLQLPATGSVAQRKFLLESKNPFTIQVTLATGYAIVYVGLYPDAPLTKYAWKAEGGIGTITMRVRTTDPNYHIGTYYYVTMQATQGRATISLKITQNKDIVQLDNSISKKELFWTNEERVKFYFFLVPTYNFTAKINIDALTEDFYPTVYLYKNIQTSKPVDFRILQYPTIKTYTMVLGDNFSQLANKKNFSYVFSDKANTSFTYYTLALYDYSYGMTDRRKAEYRISLEIQSTASSTGNGTVIVNQISDEYQPSMIERLNTWFDDTYQQIQQTFSGFHIY